MGFSCKKDTWIGRKYMRLYSDNISQLSQDQSEAAYSRGICVRRARL
jgi:hypothetical protein